MQRITRTTSRHPISLCKLSVFPSIRPSGIRPPAASKSCPKMRSNVFFVQNKNPGLIGVPFPCFACTTVDQFRQQMLSNRGWDRRTGVSKRAPVPTHLSFQVWLELAARCRVPVSLPVYVLFPVLLELWRTHNFQTVFTKSAEQVYRS